MSKEEQKYKDGLIELGCIVCRKLYGITDSPVQLHHYRSGGWGRGDYRTLIPLCPEHHTGKTGIHGMGTKAFDRHYFPRGFSQKDLLIQVQEMMSNSGENPLEEKTPPIDF